MLAGWVRKPGWTWRTPFGGGKATADDEPAVHITFDEAQSFRRWAGGHLPSDAQWLSAACTEQRPVPPPPFERGKTFRYPSGDSAAGAQCLDDCGAAAHSRAVHHGAKLLRGHGRARGGSRWYGAAQMCAEHLQSKPPGTAVVYIGFRCARGP